MSIPENTPGKKKLGRPSRAEKFGGHIAAAEQKIADCLPELIDNLLALARGVKVKDDDGIVYTTKPDRQANEYLINRIMGKVADQPQAAPDDDEEDPAVDENGTSLEP